MMVIIAVRLHNMGGSPELVEEAQRRLTFKKHYLEGGPTATQSRAALETSMAALMIHFHLNPSSPSVSHTCTQTHRFPPRHMLSHYKHDICDAFFFFFKSVQHINYEIYQGVNRDLEVRFNSPPPQAASLVYFVFRSGTQVLLHQL